MVLVAAALPGCRQIEGPLSTKIPGWKDYTRPLPPGQWALRKITDPSQIPDFTSALSGRAGLREAIARSLSYLAKPSSQAWYSRGHGGIRHADAVATLKAFDAMLAAGTGAEEMNRRIRQEFDVYISVGCDDQGTVLFTSYYTPIFPASRKRTDRFRYPLYRKPDDLAKTDDGEVLGRKGPGGKIMGPYPSRRQMGASGMLAGKELIWLADAFDVYIAHVQGSARLRLDDEQGTLITVGYTATNGHEYQSIAKMMVDDGKIPRDRLSLRAMMDYFKAHPEDVDRYVLRNPRFVFFAEEAGLPHGCLNEPVTPMRTIATDKDIYPPACLAFLDTALPRRVAGEVVIQPYQGFALDQDAGGAIRAPGRCDLYRGVGDEAGELAGWTYQEGNLYYLFLKPGRTSPPLPPPPTQPVGVEAKIAPAPK